MHRLRDHRLRYRLRDGRRARTRRPLGRLGSDLIFASFFSLPLKNRGRLAIVTAAALWSTSGVFVRVLDLPESALTVYRAGGAGALLLALAWLRRVRFSWEWRMVAMAACFTSMNYFFMASMTRTTAANAILLQYTAPFWMFLASVLLLRERVELRTLPAMTLAWLGIAVLLAGALRPDGTLEDGIAFGLLSGATYAGVAVFLRALRRHDPLWLATINMLSAGGVAAVTAGILQLTNGDEAWSRIWPPPTAGKLALLAMFSGLQLALPYVLFGWGLKYVSPQEAGILTLLEPMLNPVWTYLATGEMPSRWTEAGGSILLLSLIWETLRIKPDQEIKEAGDGRP